MRILLRLLGVLIGLGILGFGALAVAARTVGAPAEIGVRDGRLAACPETPNCVATQQASADKLMAPISFSGDATAAQERLVAYLGTLVDLEIIENRPGYVHAVARSKLFRFPDDVEFLIDPVRQQIDFRSASRLGRGDLGVNRARMERMSAALTTVAR